MRHRKILSADDLPRLRELHPGRRIAFCTGCFDIVHSGHAVFFAQCKEQADLLVVGVGTDETLRALRGPSRPVNPEANRLYLVAALHDVDYAVLNGFLEADKIDFRDHLAALRPDVVVLNADDEAAAAKTRLCESLGIGVALVPRELPPELVPTSTSQIIDRINHALRCPLRIDFAGGWTDIPFLMKGAPGFVANVAIGPLVERRGGSFNFSGYPRGSGLTTSTAAKMLEMLSSPHYVAAGKDLAAIAEDLYGYENRELHWAIGRQDMYALTYGGFNCFQCEPNRAVRVPPAIGRDLLDAFRARLVLMHTSLSRNAQRIVEEVYERHATPAGRQALAALAQLGRDFKDALAGGRLDECGEIMDRNWEAQKALAPSSSSPEIDAIQRAAHALGARGKLCGAGGGGALVFYVRDPATFLQAMKSQFSSCFEIDFEFEYRDIKTLNGL